MGLVGMFAAIIADLPPQRTALTPEHHHAPCPPQKVKDGLTYS